MAKETINKYSDEIWAIIAEIPNDACEGNVDEMSAKTSINYDGMLADEAQRSEQLCVKCGSSNTYFDGAVKMKICNDCGLWHFNT